MRHAAQHGVGDGRVDGALRPERARAERGGDDANALAELLLESGAGSGVPLPMRPGELVQESLQGWLVGIEVVVEGEEAENDLLVLLPVARAAPQGTPVVVLGQLTEEVDQGAPVHAGTDLLRLEHASAGVQSFEDGIDRSPVVRGFVLMEDRGVDDRVVERAAVVVLQVGVRLSPELGTHLGQRELALAEHAAVKGRERDDALLAVHDHQLARVRLPEQEDAGDREAEQERLDEPGGLVPPPDELPLERRNEDVLALEAADEGVHRHVRAVTRDQVTDGLAVLVRGVGRRIRVFDEGFGGLRVGGKGRRRVEFVRRPRHGVSLVHFSAHSISLDAGIV